MKNKLLNLIIPVSLLQIFLVSFLRKQESRKLKDWIPCQARNDRITDTLLYCRRMYLRSSQLKYAYCNKGVSLVEVMIALVVLLLVFIGLLQAALLGIDHNMRNLLREEAVKIVSQKTEEARGLPFDHVKSNPGVCSITNNICLVNEDCANGETCNTPSTATISSCADPNYPIRIDRNFRNIQNFPFGLRMTVTDILDPDGVTLNTKQIDILAAWEYKNECYTQSITTVRRR